MEMLGCLQAAGAPYSCGPACPAGQESQIRSTKLVVLSAGTNSPGLITPLFILHMQLSTVFSLPGTAQGYSFVAPLE